MVNGTYVWYDVGSSHWRADEQDILYLARLRAIRAVDELIGSSSE